MEEEIPIGKPQLDIDQATADADMAEENKNKVVQLTVPQAQEHLNKNDIESRQQTQILGVQKESTQVQSQDQVGVTADQATTTMINTCTDAVAKVTMVAEMPRTDSIIEAEDIAAVTPAVETETRYSWFYFEREDQFEDLFESLNLKGQRERKLQENLKKIKDRLKLKKSKRVPVKPDQSAPQNTTEIQSQVAVDGQEEGNGIVQPSNENGVEGPQP